MREGVDFKHCLKFTFTHSLSAQRAITVTRDMDKKWTCLSTELHVLCLATIGIHGYSKFCHSELVSDSSKFWFTL